MKRPSYKRKPAPDWFGCGRVITTESWNAFLKAQREYWEKKDANAMILDRITSIEKESIR